MRVLIAPDKLKGSLDASAAARAMAAGAARVVGDGAIDLCPVADGGEGTLEVLAPALAASPVALRVSDALGRTIPSAFGLAAGSSTAIVESASAIGLGLLGEAERDPLRTTSYGVGELVRAALDAGATRILVALGGSATADGGAGFAQALGVRFVGAPEPIRGADLRGVTAIDRTAIDERLARVDLVAACDVGNPLYGPDGSAIVYAPQKGASHAVAAELDRGLEHLAALVGGEHARTPGAGAAGGLGFALAAFGGARLVSGAELVLDALELDRRLASVDLVLTGEGRLDRQTRAGKALHRVAARAERAGVACVALVGELALSNAEVRAIGIDAAFALCSGPAAASESLARASELCEARAEAVVRVFERGLRRRARRSEP